MASNSSAARTNLTSNAVRVHENRCVGEGTFRVAFSGTFQGGTRNQQEAVCKKFKSPYRVLESEFFASDFKVADRAIQYAEDWNNMCHPGVEILVTMGSEHVFGKERYLVEPFIRDFQKFTSNNGWIADADEVGWEGEVAEAYCHYTYHRSGGQMIVCELQGRYKYNRYNPKKSRLQLTDPAVCSRRRNYGPTDLGDKGIDSFFANHECNQFCHVDGVWHLESCGALPNWMY